MSKIQKALYDDRTISRLKATLQKKQEQGNPGDYSVHSEGGFEIIPRTNDLSYFDDLDDNLDINTIYFEVRVYHGTSRVHAKTYLYTDPDMLKRQLGGGQLGGTATDMDISPAMKLFHESQLANKDQQIQWQKQQIDDLKKELEEAEKAYLAIDQKAKGDDWKELIKGLGTAYMATQGGGHASQNLQGIDAVDQSYLEWVKSIKQALDDEQFNVFVSFGSRLTEDSSLIDLIS